ncbi:MAG: hypothetical protein RQ733_03245 [Methyloprofundus sp.]|nr:hypothetical protein [Methyloprofundus sp.]MDT8424969.1 hypothetical protein [Methyloprofundus sp.]
MKLLKPLLLSAFLGASMGAFSTAALAECEDGRTCYEPAEAIDITVEKIMEARHAIDNGADTSVILELINEAKNLNKEINANDIVDRNRQRANSYLNKARSEVKKSALQPADAHLLEAETRFKALHSML